MAEERGVNLRAAAEHVAGVQAQAQGLAAQLLDLANQYGENTFERLLMAAVDEGNPGAVRATAALLAGQMGHEGVEKVLAEIQDPEGVEVGGVNEGDLGMSVSREMAVLMMAAQALGLSHTVLQLGMGTTEAPAALAAGNERVWQEGRYDQERGAKLRAKYSSVQSWLNDDDNCVEVTINGETALRIRRSHLKELISAKNPTAADMAIFKWAERWVDEVKGAFLRGGTEKKPVYYLGQLRAGWFLKFIAEKSPGKLLLPMAED